MTEEQKEQQIRHLYDMLDKCGQILAEWDDEKPPTYYKREYRRIMKTLAKLEPENWNYPAFQKKDYAKRNESVAKWCNEHKCPKCGGELNQSRSGSFRVVCKQCGAKFQLKVEKKRNN